MPTRMLTGHNRFNRRVLAALTVVVVLALVGASSYAVYIHRIATLLVITAREIQTTDDALRQFNIWKGRTGVQSGVDSYDSGRGTNYWVQLSNRGIARLHLAPPSALTLGISLYDLKLVKVSVEMSTPSAAAVAEEWFKPWASKRLSLGFIKSAVPTARLQFPSSLSDDQKEAAFVFRKRCLLIPSLCTTPDDLLPAIRTLESSATPDERNNGG